MKELVIIFLFIILIVSVWKAIKLKKKKQQSSHNNPHTYEEAKETFIGDLQQVVKSGELFQYSEGAKSYTASELLYEVKKETAFGKRCINNFLRGCQQLPA